MRNMPLKWTIAAAILITLLITGQPAQGQTLDITCTDGVLHPSFYSGGASAPTVGGLRVVCLPYTPTPTQPTVDPTPTLTPTFTPTFTPTVVPVPSGVLGLNNRHPDAGIWVAYPGQNTASDLRKPYIQGIMAYASWQALYPAKGQFDWSTLDDDLDFAINQAGKRAFVNVVGGYCPANPFPAAFRAAVAQRKTISTQGCKPLQFWDPLYFDIYEEYIRALANHLAAFDSTDDRPTVTDILFVRAAVMGDTVENLPNPSNISEFRWADFNPAPNGHLLQVNYSDALGRVYYHKVLASYTRELARAYAAKGLLPPNATADLGGNFWEQTASWQTIVGGGHWVDTHATAPAMSGGWYDLALGTVNNQTRATSESYGSFSEAGAWLAMNNYWEALGSVALGIEFIGIYANNKFQPSVQPKGAIGYPPNLEGLLFGDRYAGTARNPATSPGCWVALRGWYPEKNFSGTVYMQRVLWDYEHCMTLTNAQDSQMLFGIADLSSRYIATPLVVRSAGHAWAADKTACLKDFTAHQCASLGQPPDKLIGTVGGQLHYTYKTTDLGKVQWCNDTEMFCSGPGVTHTERMLWARRTQGKPLRFDVADTFANSLTMPPTIRVVYLDSGVGQWALDVDGATVLTVTKGDTGVWKEVSLAVPQGALALALDPLDDGEDVYHLLEVTR